MGQINCQGQVSSDSVSLHLKNYVKIPFHYIIHAQNQRNTWIGLQVDKYYSASRIKIPDLIAEVFFFILESCPSNLEKRMTPNLNGLGDIIHQCMLGVDQSSRLSYLTVEEQT